VKQAVSFHSGILVPAIPIVELSKYLLAKDKKLDRDVAEIKLLLRVIKRQPAKMRLTGPFFICCLKQALLDCCLKT
jgi:hypothetical protein